MGLFSFIKNAGAKIFGKKSAPAAEAAPVELSKVDALTAEVRRLGIPVDNLHIELAEERISLLLFLLIVPWLQ